MSPQFGAKSCDCDIRCRRGVPGECGPGMEEGSFDAVNAILCGCRVSKGRACFGSRSILVDLAEESSDGGHHRACACCVGQIETVTDTW